MNLREHAILSGINIAGAHDPDFWCTAEEIAETVKTYEYACFDDVRKVLGKINATQVGWVLRGLLHRGTYQEPLVEKRRVRGVNQWRMTEKAAKVAIA